MAENGSEGNNTLTVRDNRTGREYEIDIREGDARSRSRTTISG